MRAGTFGPQSYHDLQARLGGTMSYRRLFSVSFDGEKNLGEMGPAKTYKINYEVLRARSWQLLLDSEVAQTVLGKYNTWLIGKGLKLQSEPVKKVLEAEGVTVDAHEFSESVESRFRLYSGSTVSDFTNMENLDFLQATALKNAQVGGDVVVILRYNKAVGTINVQLIDGTHLQSPIGYGTEDFPRELPNGNRIENGIELSPNNEHVAYYIRKAGFGFETERIQCKKGGHLVAYMVYGNKYRLDNHRGLPLLAVMFETAKKLERYKEATVGSAEERQKIAYFFEHQIFSDGDNPLLKQTAIARDTDNMFSGVGDGTLPLTQEGERLASHVAATTNKMTFNMPRGATIKTPDSKQELYFKDFYGVNIDLFCSAAEIPPEVAMSKYDSNFSASRAALKDWEHSLNVKRTKFSFQFLRPILNLWMHIEISMGRINAPGYLEAFYIKRNWIVMEAYRKARWAGASVPHIDPLKEVQAERLKLGDTGASLPLTTQEAATENLNGGDADANTEQFAEELQTSKDLDIVPMPEPIALDPNARPNPASGA